MVLKMDSEKIENFTFIPVGGTPDGGNRIDGGSWSASADFQTQTFVSGNRVEVVDDFEARLNGVTIDGGNGAEADEIQLALQPAADFDHAGRYDFEGQLAEIVRAGDGGIGCQDGGRKLG